MCYWLRYYKIVVISFNITTSDTTTIEDCYSLRRGDIGYAKKEVIVSSIISVFRFSSVRLGESESFFLAKTICTPREILPHNFSPLGLTVWRR